MRDEGQHQANEYLRKTIHIAGGLGAITLRWLPWWLAAAVALAAVIGNWLLLHKIVGRRVARHEQGWDVGIVLYPLAVALLIVVFRDNLAIAAIAWVILAFGDGFATIAGRAIRGPRIPWNRDKSWSGFAAFIAAGLFGALAMGAWMEYGNAWAILLAVVAAAVVESLPLRVDDNLTVPATAAITLLISAVTPAVPYTLPPHSTTWLAVNTILAAVGYAARSVDRSGAAGGWLLGTILILAGGWPAYAALLAFFIIGSGVTKLGYRRKAAAGLAQEQGGRRSFSHAFSNVGVAAICAIAFSRYSRAEVPTEVSAVIFMMVVASLATAAADTTASEIGQLIGRRTFLPLTFRRVPVGTEGAISIEGTVAGIVAAFVVAAVGAAQFGLMFIILITIAATIGSYVESVAGSWNRKRRERVPNGVLNFFNTAVGAIVFYSLARPAWLIGA